MPDDLQDTGIAKRNTDVLLLTRLRLLFSSITRGIPFDGYYANAERTGRTPMQMPNSQKNAGPSSQHIPPHIKNLADKQARLRELREQRELIRMRMEKEQWLKASQLPKTFPDVRDERKEGSRPNRSTFFTKLSLGKLLE